MIVRLNPQEWMVEPENQDDREYARLHVKATAFGINIDGQGTISWDELMDAFQYVEILLKQRN